MATPIRRLFTDRELFGEQAVNRLEGGEFALLDLLDGVVEGFERARHAQADQMGSNTIQNLGHRTASAASLCATAS